MIKVMIVEDETDVREGIVAELAWQQYGFEVVCTAENGREAMDLLETTAPDIVVTDICMPFMSGLELASYIRKERPWTKVIILTGIDEFEYAQQAVKLEIKEYLLKPFSNNELLEVLLKVKQAIVDESNAARDLERLRSHYNQSIPVLKQSFLSSLLSMQLTVSETKRRASLAGLSLEGKAFLVSVIRIDKINEESYGLDSNQSLQLFAIANITEEINATFSRESLVFMHGADVIMLDLCQEGSGETLLKLAASKAEEIRRSVEQYISCTVTIGIGSPIYLISEIKAAYDSAIRALDYQLILGNNRIIQIEDIEKTDSQLEPIVFDELKQRAFVSCLKVGSQQELAEMIQEMFVELTNKSSNMQDSQLYLLELVTTILRVTKDSGVALNRVLKSEASIFAQFEKCSSYEETKNWVLEVSEGLRAEIATERHTSQMDIIDKAKEYIRNHYENPELSVQCLCDELHISNGYFSSLFKKETKTTFVSYLQSYRIERAKELLRSSDLKAFVIAEKVGYSDPNYFSFAFKKLVGMSPKEFRHAPREVQG